MSLAVGKIRGFQQLTTQGRFKIVAIDHRDVFVEMMKSAGRYHGTDDVIREKLDIINACKSETSGFLIDPHFALPSCITQDVLPGGIGFLVNIEDNDYSAAAFGANYCIKDFSVEKIKRMGASAVKMFLYYNPESGCTQLQEKLISSVGQSCKENDILFLLEPVLMGENGKRITAEDRVRLTNLTIDRLKNLGIDIFKIDFPGDVQEYSDEENIRICEQVSQRLDVPWVIMSSGVDETIFEKQLMLACRGGASGYVVGRALWKEYVLCADDQREKERERVRKIIRRLNKIVDQYVKPVPGTPYIQEEVRQENWYQMY